MHTVYRILSAGCLAASAAATGSPAVAGPLPTNIAAVKSVVPAGVIEVHWRGTWSGGWRHVWFPGGVRPSRSLTRWAWGWGAYYGCAYYACSVYWPGYAYGKPYEWWNPWRPDWWRHPYWNRDYQ
jgi:hypothetical protein